jgi:hypothetical protein
LASSARFKRGIEAIGERSAGLLRVRPVTFRYKQDPQGTRQYGPIAEEVARVYPELVTREANGAVASVQYNELIPMLLNELQRQERELQRLKSQNAALASRFGSAGGGCSSFRLAGKSLSAAASVWTPRLPLWYSDLRCGEPLEIFQFMS